MPIPPPLRIKIIYAIGQMGWSMAAYCAVNLLTYFYLPPETSDTPLFPPFIYQGAIFGLFTLIGLIGAGARLFDAVIDPMIASLSDNSKSSLGKRRFFMAIGMIPIALFTFLIYYPPTTDITINSIWLVICTLLYFVAITFYVVPYTTLICELGHSAQDQLQISALVGAAWVIGFLFSNTVFVVQGFLEQYWSATVAFQTAIGIYCITALVCMALPVFFVNEKKYCRTTQSEMPLKKAMRNVLSNRNFTYFSLALTLYWASLTFIILGSIYYVTILLASDKANATIFGGIGLTLGLLLYPFVYRLTTYWGKKKVVSAAFLTLSFILGSCTFLGKYPFPLWTQLYLLPAITAFPFACMGIVPNAIIADIISEQEQLTGQSQPAMYYAVRAFMVKLGMSLGTLIFPSLLLLGKSTNNDLGIRLTGVVAMLLCLMGFFIFQKYQQPEKGMK